MLPLMRGRAAFGEPGAFPSGIVCCACMWQAGWDARRPCYHAHTACDTTLLLPQARPGSEWRPCIAGAVCVVGVARRLGAALMLAAGGACARPAGACCHFLMLPLMRGRAAFGLCLSRLR